MKKIYCDISATTPVDQQVIDFMMQVHKNAFGNPSSVHKYGQESHIVIEKARIDTSEALNCCLLYTSPSPRDKRQSRMPSSA